MFLFYHNHVQSGKNFTLCKVVLEILREQKLSEAPDGPVEMKGKQRLDFVCFALLYDTHELRMLLLHLGKIHAVQHIETK